jgi:hypothetical protein
VRVPQVAGFPVNRVIRGEKHLRPASYSHETGLQLAPPGDPSGRSHETKEAGVKRTWTIAFALAIVVAALALPGSALSQALIIGTNGQPGDGDHTVAPVSVEQQNGDTSASAEAGSDNGSAATAGTQNGDDGGNAVVGCIDGAAATGDSALTGSAGNCGSGDGGSAKAGTTKDDTNAGAGLGCIALGLVGATNGDAQAGSCEESGGGGGGGDSGGGPGSGGDDSGGGGGSGGGPDDGGSGATSHSAGSAGPGSGGSGSGGGQGSGLCGGISELASLTGPGSVPVWMLALGTLGAFASGVLFARRRSDSAPA